MAIVSGQAGSLESADATSGHPVATGSDDARGWPQAPSSQAATNGSATGSVVRNGPKGRSAMSHTNENSASGQT